MPKDPAISLERSVALLHHTFRGVPVRGYFILAVPLPRSSSETTTCGNAQVFQKLDARTARNLVTTETLSIPLSQPVVELLLKEPIPLSWL